MTDKRKSTDDVESLFDDDVIVPFKRTKKAVIVISDDEDDEADAGIVITDDEDDDGIVITDDEDDDESEARFTLYPEQREAVSKCMNMYKSSMVGKAPKLCVLSGHTGSGKTATCLGLLDKLFEYNTKNAAKNAGESPPVAVILLPPRGGAAVAGQFLTTHRRLGLSFHLNEVKDVEQLDIFLERSRKSHQALLMTPRRALTLATRPSSSSFLTMFERRRVWLFGDEWQNYTNQTPCVRGGSSRRSGGGAAAAAPEKPPTPKLATVVHALTAIAEFSCWISAGLIQRNGGQTTGLASISGVMGDVNTIFSELHCPPKMAALASERSLKCNWGFPNSFERSGGKSMTAVEYFEGGHGGLEGEIAPEIQRFLDSIVVQFKAGSSTTGSTASSGSLSSTSTADPIQPEYTLEVGIESYEFCDEDKSLFEQIYAHYLKCVAQTKQRFGRSTRTELAMGIRERLAQWLTIGMDAAHLAALLHAERYSTFDQLKDVSTQALWTEVKSSLEAKERCNVVEGFFLSAAESSLKAQLDETRDVFRIGTAVKKLLLEAQSSTDGGVRAIFIHRSRKVLQLLRDYLVSDRFDLNVEVKICNASTSVMDLNDWLLATEAYPRICLMTGKLAGEGYDLFGANTVLMPFGAADTISTMHQYYSRMYRPGSAVQIGTANERGQVRQFVGIYGASQTYVSRVFTSFNPKDHFATSRDPRMRKMWECIKTFLEASSLSDSAKVRDVVPDVVPDVDVPSPIMLPSSATAMKFKDYFAKEEAPKSSASSASSAPAPIVVLPSTARPMKFKGAQTVVKKPSTGVLTIDSDTGKLNFVGEGATRLIRAHIDEHNKLCDSAYMKLDVPTKIIIAKSKFDLIRSIGS